MKKGLLIFIFLLFGTWIYAPPNCNNYKDSSECQKACKAAWKAIRYPQGSYESQKHFQKSLELCPTFAYSYMEKAVPFLKRGLFIEWKKMIDHAVKLSPEEYLGYRGWCRLQFLRDYEGAIQDIEKLKSLVEYDIGYCQNGDYHLNIALALCYKAINDLGTARRIFMEQIESENYPVGLYDYYHLGILAFEEGNFEEALIYFHRQVKVNDHLGETYYYLALVHKALNHMTEYIENLEKAESYYRQGKMRTDTYSEPLDKIYLNDILEEMDLVNTLKN